LILGLSKPSPSLRTDPNEKMVLRLRLGSAPTAASVSLESINFTAPIAAFYRSTARPNAMLHGKRLNHAGSGRRPYRDPGRRLFPLRSGRYSLDTLIGRHGPGFGIPDCIARPKVCQPVPDTS
jgi:hypothetical protein